MLIPIDDLNPDVVAFRGEGTITAKDYSEQLVPALERVLENGGRPRFLYVLGSSFEKYDLGAMLADSRVGISHWDDFDRIAVVTDRDWIENAVRAFGVLIPCPVRIFGDDELDTAKAWVNDRTEDKMEIEVTATGEMAFVHARLRGALDRSAEDQLIKEVTGGIGDAGEVRLLIEAVDFHGWRDLRALCRHIRFAVGQRAIMERVALVGDAKWQSRLVSMARHVLRVEAHFFASDQLADAKAWLED